MRLLTIIFLIIICSCGNTKKINNELKNDSTYLINKIDSLNSWNIIYATKQDVTYKIIVHKEDVDTKACKKIIVGKYYELNLNSRKNNVLEIDGVKVSPINNLDVNCYTYDDMTEICIEPKKGINDLYHTEDIKGFCYVK